MLLGRLIKWINNDGWFWRRGFWYLTPIALLSLTLVIGIVYDTTGVNVLDETVNFVVNATERSQPVTLTLCGAALAAGLLGLTVVVPRVLSDPGGDTAQVEKLETAALGLVLNVWAAAFVFVFQWLFAALSADPQWARVMLAFSVVLWLILVVDGLTALPLWLVGALRSERVDNAADASSDISTVTDSTAPHGTS